MKLYLDTANIEQLQAGSRFSCFQGVTTNPTILFRANNNRFKQLRAILETVDGLLFIQLVGDTYETMLEDFKRIKTFKGDNPNIVYKVAIDEIGLQIIKAIKEDDPYNLILGTTIYTIEQVMLALSAGCDYIAPYYNRIKRNKKGDPNKLIEQARVLIDREQHHCEIIAASFKSVDEVVDAFLMGAHSCTISYDIFMAMLEDDVVSNDLKQFNLDHQQMMSRTVNE